MQLDQTDIKILQLIQVDFPITSRPYQAIAEKIGTTESDVISRLGRLQENGIIRRLGGLFDSRKMGYSGTLCAMKVPAGDIDRVAEILNDYPGITHNYLRDYDYNMWFTLLTQSPEQTDTVLEEIKKRTGMDDILNLPSINVFKVRVKFDL